jgi:hypothetical protein
VFLAAISGIGPGRHGLFRAKTFIKFLKTFIKFLNGIQLTGLAQAVFELFGNKPTFFVSGFS